MSVKRAGTASNGLKSVYGFPLRTLEAEAAADASCTMPATRASPCASGRAAGKECFERERTVCPSVARVRQFICSTHGDYEYDTREISSRGRQVQ